MSVERRTGRFFLLALSSLTLAACSPSNSTAAPAPQSAAPAAAAVTTAPLVTGLPDFTALVERYGPAVVNVQVTEKRTQPRRGDPRTDLFRQFGLEIPDAPGEDRPQRGQPPDR